MCVIYEKKRKIVYLHEMNFGIRKCDLNKVYSIKY